MFLRSCPQRPKYTCVQYAFFLGVVGSLHKRKRYAGFGDNGGEEKEKDSAEESFSYGPPLNLLYYILYMCEC